MIKTISWSGSKRMARVAGIFMAFIATASLGALADAAKDCEQDKDLKLRVQGCTQFLNSSPPAGAQAVARLYRGWAYERLGQADAAITDLTESIRIKADAFTFALRAGAYEMQQRYDLAVTDYNSALQLKPDYVEVYLYRGNCRLIKGDGTGAIADLNILIQKKPDMPAGYYLRARANELVNQQDAAIADLTYVMSIDPKHKATAYFYRALANEAKGRTDLAEADFKDAIALRASLAMERRWVEYLKSIQADGDYANWSGKPYELYLRNGGDA